jgi:hypothetical protein
VIRLSGKVIWNVNTAYFLKLYPNLPRIIDECQENSPSWSSVWSSRRVVVMLCMW